MKIPKVSNLEYKVDLTVAFHQECKLFSNNKNINK